MALACLLPCGDSRNARLPAWGCRAWKLRSVTIYH